MGNLFTSETKPQKSIFMEETMDIQDKMVPLTLIKHVKRTEGGRKEWEKADSVEMPHSACLFVDISGFTSLSSKLTCEDLKLVINVYFTLMIDVVRSNGGDVVKFCGDAVLILWTGQLSPAAAHSNSDAGAVANSDEGASRAAHYAARAMTCAVGIQRACHGFHVRKRIPQALSANQDIILVLLNIRVVFPGHVRRLFVHHPSLSLGPGPNANANTDPNRIPPSLPSLYRT